MDRRHFVHRSLGAAALLTYGGPIPLPALTPRFSAIDRWGLQLYTVRSLMASNVEETLAHVARIGYREVEFAGYFSRSPQEIRMTLEAENLVAPAIHLSLEEFRQNLEPAIEAATIIGHRHLVLPFLAAADRPDIDGYQRLAGEMNRFGEACHEAGLRFAYHNHDFELRAIEGVVPLDILIDGTDPDLVTFEVDLYWMVHGGADPLDYFTRYPGRFELCHVKDRTRDGKMVDVGNGVIDFAEIFRHAETAGLTHYFVEHDTPDDALESVRTSFEYLASLRV